MTTTPNTPNVDPNGNPQLELGNNPAAAVPATPQPNQATAVPEWFDAKKYGEYTPENIARQATDYHNAVRGMNSAQQEKAEAVRRAKELEEAIINGQQQQNYGQPYGGQQPQIPPQQQYGHPQAPQYQQPAPQPIVIPEHLRASIEASMPGMTAEQIVGFRMMVKDVIGSTVAPINERFINSDVERVKADLRTRDRYFADYETDFDAILKTYPMEQRSNPVVIGRAMSEARGRKLDDIIQKNLVAPQSPPNMPSPTTTTAPAKAVEYDTSEDNIKALVSKGYMTEAAARELYKK